MKHRFNCASPLTAVSLEEAFEASNALSQSGKLVPNGRDLQTDVGSQAALM